MYIEGCKHTAAKQLFIGKDSLFIRTFPTVYQTIFDANKTKGTAKYERFQLDMFFQITNITWKYIEENVSSYSMRMTVTL